MNKEKLALEIYNVAMEIKKQASSEKIVIDPKNLDKEEHFKNVINLFYLEDLNERTICGYLRDNKNDSLKVIKDALSEPSTAFYLLYKVDACYESDEILNNIDTLHYLTDGLMENKKFQELLNRVDEMVMEDADYLKMGKLYKKIKNLEKHVKNYCEILKEQEVKNEITGGNNYEC